MKWQGSVAAVLSFWSHNILLLPCHVILPLRLNLIGDVGDPTFHCPFGVGYQFKAVLVHAPEADKFVISVQQLVRRVLLAIDDT
jgi:hypothetical protein